MASISSASSASVRKPFPIGPATASSAIPISASVTKITTITTSSSSSSSSSSTASTFSTTSISTTSTTILASSTSGTTPTPTVLASVFPGNDKYQYFGCYNETTGVNGTGGKRALYGGAMEALESMTAPLCLNFCNIDGFKYAGLEYTKECWCSQYISVFSTRLDESQCNLPCTGNRSQICGGSLALTVYQSVPSQQSSRAPELKVGPTKLLIAGLAILGLVMDIL